MTATETAQGPYETTGPTEDRPHFRGFEALRALAALMVVVHHASSLAGPVRSGRVATVAAVFDGGVAVFFVLSGFLLFRPMIAADLAGRPAQRWRSFWWRRILRIVPAYWLALSVLWAIGAFGLGGGWWRYYLFIQIYNPKTVLGGIAPAWSLATEMSFYLMLPLFGALVARVAAAVGRARIVVHLGACGVLWVAGFVARYGFDHYVPSKRGLSFEWLPTNLDLFATGMALAVVSAAVASGRGPRALLDRVATPVWPWWTAAGALFAWYAYRVGPTSFAVGYTGWFWHQRQLVLALFTALLLVPAVFGPQDRGLLRRLWSWRPIVWVGTVSYGWYLWHLDVMHEVIDRRWFGLALGDVAFPTVVLVGVAGGLVVAAVSYYGLERPLQRHKGRFDRPQVPVGERTGK